MRTLRSASEMRFLLFGFMLLFAFSGTLSLLLDNYYILCIPFAILLLLTSIEGVEIIFFFLVALIPLSIEQKVTNTLSTDFPDELLMWLITIIVWTALLANRKLRIQLFAFRHPLWNIIALSLIWIFISMLFSSHLTISIKYLLSKFWYLTCFFILPVIIFSRLNHLKRIFQLLFLSMLVVVIYAFINQISMNFSFLQVNETVRPFFRNHVNYSALLACIIPVLFVTLFGTKKITWKILISSAMIICTLNLIFAYSRGAWLGLICCPIFYFILKRKLVKPFLVVVFAIFALAIFVLTQTDVYKKAMPSKEQTVYHTNFSQHLKATYELTDMSFAERLYRWTGGVNMFVSKPLMGYGPNTFYRNYKAHTNAAYETWVSANYEKSSIHNYYLLQFAEQGIVGGFLFLLLIYLAFSRIEKIYHSHLKSQPFILSIGFILVVICVELCVNDLIETDKIGSIFYLGLAGIIIIEKSIAPVLQEVETFKKGNKFE